MFKSHETSSILIASYAPKDTVRRIRDS